MKKKLGIRTLAAILAASVVMSASTGMVFAKNGANVSATGDVSDTSAVSETTSRAAAKNLPATVSVEGAALNSRKVPTGLSGTGTADSPYEIGSLNDLLLMNGYINYESASSKHFVLTKDIDLSKVTFSHFTESDGIWALVSAKASLSGNGNVRFILNGNGHKLYGMNTSVSKNVSTGAIFGYINANSSIENLTIESCTLRVNRDADGAFAVLAVQNCGTIKNCTMKDCVLDARLGSVQQRDSGESFIAASDNRVYYGHAIGVADNAGKVQNFTATGSDTNKGVFVKGARRYIGVVAGQNRKDISGASVSGLRIVSYGSEDADTSVAGKGEVSGYIGMIAGRNISTATVSSAKVALSGAAVLFGDPVGGVVGENAGSIEKATVSGTLATGAAVSTSSANLYGYGRYGAIAGTNSGNIESCGAYDVGFCFAKGDGANAYGGIAGTNSGTITSCAASGSVNLQNSASAGVGGLVGCVQSGTTLIGNYAIVSASQNGANVGALLGRDGTAAYVGQNNYWTSQGSGLSSAVPGAGDSLNDLTPATSVIVLTKSTSGVTLNDAALAWSWQGGKASASADFTKSFVVDNKAIRLNKTSNSVTLSCTDEGMTGTLSYTVSISVPAGGGHKLSARVNVPVFVTASEKGGAGSSAKNPVVISNAAQMQIMQHSPNAHYELKTDITLGTDWTPVDFTGTLDGNGHTLRIAKPLFSSVSGTRSGSVSASDWKDSAANLGSGYIYDLTIVPTTCVSGGVFGDVKDATLRDVTYTVSEADDGFVALSKAKSGALVDTLSGSAYLKDCTVSVPIAVTAANADGIGALVGYASVTNLVAEGCATSSLMSLENNPANVGGLFGNIESVAGNAELIDCSATGCVYVPSVVPEVRAKIMIGAAASGVKASGCTYAATAGVAGGSVAKDAAPFKDGISLLNPQSEEAKQGAEDTRSMLELIDPEKIDEAAVNGLSLDNGVYKLYTAQDVLDMATQIDTTTAGPRQAIYELQNDIDMNGAALRMSTGVTKAFMGTFRGKAGGTDTDAQGNPTDNHKCTLSNFTVSNTTTTTNYASAAALFCYANGATFDNFALKDVTVVNKGMGTAVLVGYADKSGTSGVATNGTATGNDSACSFTNIEITDCDVFSIKSVSGYQWGVGNECQAGTLIGAVWSASTGDANKDAYTITGIKVTNCTVENRNWDSTWSHYSDCANHTGGGAWSLGGLIGASRMKKSGSTPNVDTATLCIGASGDANKIVLDNVTVIGYGFVGGVLGHAGDVALTAQGATSFTAANYHGGVKIRNVEVTGSTIEAGDGTNQGGCCAGILAAEIVKLGGASIEDCTVSDTTITSHNNAGTVAQFYTECAGIAAHMSGVIRNCTVEDCTISSCTVGGIVCRSSKKSTGAYDSANPNSECTLLTIENCNVIGETEITSSFNGANNEGGGILSAARNANVIINNCGVGSDVHVHGYFLYLGGFIGYSIGSFTVMISDSVMLGKVEILDTIANSVGAGGVAYAGLGSGYLHIDSCVFGGEINVDTWYCGGVLGQYTQDADCTNLVTKCTIISRLQKSTASGFTAGNNRTGRIMAYLSSSNFVVGGNNTNYWMRTDNVAHVFSNNIVSSYPDKLVGDLFSDANATPPVVAETCPTDFIPCFGICNNTTTPLMYTTSSLKESYLMSSSVHCVEDVNRPNSKDLANGYSSVVNGHDVVHANYLHDANSTYVISGVRTATLTISNTIDSNASFTSRLDFDTTTVAADSKYSGWMSTSNGNVSVEETDTTATNVELKAKQDTESAGVTANYNIIKSVAVAPATENTYFTNPDNGERVQISVCIPIATRQIPPDAFEDGDGTQGSPYLIYTIQDLNKLRQLDLSTDTYYQLANDIDLTQSNVFDQAGEFYFDGTFFKPIVGLDRGNGTAFKGHFLGDGNSIIGLKINNRNLGTNNATAVTGLFAETDGATISDLTLDQAEIQGATANVGGLVGTANNTTFENITITNSTITGTSATTVYAGALAAYVTDSSATETTLECVTVTNAYFAGGVYGHAHYTYDTTNSRDNTNEVLGTTIIGLTVTSVSTSSLTGNVYAGNGRMDAAGGIAAEFSGTIGSTTGADPVNTTITAQADDAQLQIGGFGDGEQAVYDTVPISTFPVTITAANASAVVGFVDTTGYEALSGDPPTLTAQAFTAKCTIENVTVGDGVDYYAVVNNDVTNTIDPPIKVISTTDSAAAAAGGVVGKVRFDSSDNDDTNYAEPPTVKLTVNGCKLEKDVSVSAIHYAGGVLGASDMTDGSIEIKNCTSFASVSASGSDGAVGAMAGRFYSLKGVWVDHCAASGKLSAQAYCGGVIGQVSGTAAALVLHPADYQATVNNATVNRGIVSNTVFSAAFNPPANATPARAVVFGDVPTTILSNEETASPFVNIYYSSYKLDTALVTTVSQTDYVKLAGNELYADYRATFVDLMTEFNHHYLDANNNNADVYDDLLTVKRDGLTLGASDVRIWSGKTSGNFWSFVCPSGVQFDLDSIYSEDRADRINFEWHETSGTRDGVKLTVKNDGSGHAVFYYTNGLKLSLELLATDIPGKGTTQEPYLIERISHMDAIKSFPTAEFCLAADLDFSSTATTTEHGDPLTEDERSWESGWEEWAKSLSTSGKQFTGKLDGSYYPWGLIANPDYDENDPESPEYIYGYDTTQTPVVHTISNLTVSTQLKHTDASTHVESNYSNDIAGVGLFPMLPADATVQNLKFSCCSFSTDVAGKNVGVLVGENYGTVTGIEVDNGLYTTTTGENDEEITSLSGSLEAASGSYVNNSANTNCGNQHVGAIAGVSFAPLTYCTVKNAKVNSTHCAGGVVGGCTGADASHNTVAHCTVTNVTVTGREYAGGIAGGTMTIMTNPAEFTYDDTNGTTGKTYRAKSTFSDCTVSGSTIQSDAQNKPYSSSVGGILGVAESGHRDSNAGSSGNINDVFRSVSIDHCTVDADTTVKALCPMNQTANYTNYAGGILGKLEAMYSAFSIENCASYADVYAYGKKTPDSNKITYPSASALVGIAPSSTQHRPSASGVATYRLINNICSGTVRSSEFAGGVFGYFGVKAESGYAISSGEFACGNIISAKFAALPDSNDATTSTDKFGVFIGYCLADAFASTNGTTVAPSTMTDNYFSSDVSSIGGRFSRFGTGSPVNACAGLYDVAARSSVNATTVLSSLQVQNHEYVRGSFNTTTGEYEFALNPIYESASSPKYEDTLIAPCTKRMTAQKDEQNNYILDQQGHYQPVPLTVNGVEQYRYPGFDGQNDTVALRVKLQFNKDMTGGTSSSSGDYASINTSEDVYNPSGFDQNDVHTLRLQSIYVDPTDSGYYEATKTVDATDNSRSAASFKVKDNPENCYSEHSLVADLGYGLLVKIVIKTKVGSGTEGDPYNIESAYKFAHYFFGSFAQDPANEYNHQHYAQVADFDFDDVYDVIANGDADHPNESFNTFAPIGSSSVPFYGSYDGGGYRIIDFHYEEPLIEDAGAWSGGATRYRYAHNDVGLFGYVQDTAGGNSFHFKNIHIELKETPLDSDNIAFVNGENTEYKASVCGGINTGGLVGKYQSTVAIDNCSVVYGTVRSGTYGNVSVLMTNPSTYIDSINTSTVNVGGLVGWIKGYDSTISNGGTVETVPLLVNCFTSTNVRAGEEYTYPTSASYTATSSNYTCGGLVGLNSRVATPQSGATVTHWDTTYSHCFTTSDVIGPTYVGGFVGKVDGVYMTIKLADSASMATVTALQQLTDNNYGACLVVGYSSGGMSYNNAQYVQANNVFVAGMNTTEYNKIIADSSAQTTTQRYPLLFGTGPLLSNSSNVIYDASALGRITAPNGDSSPDLIRVTGELCNGSGVRIANGVAPFTAMKTEDLLQSTFTGLGSAWYPSDGVLYPVLKMSTTGDGESDRDSYFSAFSELASLPMKIDSREADDVTIDRLYAGVTYPTTISKTLGKSIPAEVDENNNETRPAYNAPALSIEASKYSAWSEKVAYNGNYDYLLSGNKSNNDDRADMATDLLFNRGTDSSNTSTYNRTDARGDYQILRNTYLTTDYTYTDENQIEQTYHFSRNEKSPFVRVSGRVRGFDVHRTIHIGLRGSENTVYVATERQLRAITVDGHEGQGKFYDAFKDTINYDGNNTESKNIRICADITFNCDSTKRSSFTPITGYQASPTAGTSFEGAFGFDGSNCEIRNLWIENAGSAGGGLFSSILSGSPQISNLILRNPDITGSHSVGALVGKISTTNSVKISNCMVIGGRVGVSAAGSASSIVGGLVGELTGVSSASREIEQIGVVGVQISNASTAVASSAGMMFGSVSDTSITNVYAVGELNVSANNVGILAGECTDCSVNRVVTSGYVSNTNAGGNVGGVIGQMIRNGSGTSLKNAESTAFVSGATASGESNRSKTIGGIVGYAAGGTDVDQHIKIDRVIFAGGFDGNAQYKSSILANSSVRIGQVTTPVTADVTNACFNSDLQLEALTADNNSYNPTATLALVRGTGTPSKAVMSSGYTEYNNTNDATDPDNGKYKYTDTTGGSYVYDTSSRYYPNPVSLVSVKSEYGQIGHVISDEYKAGLCFALARINLSYSGVAGTVKEYDQISMISPISINVYSSVLDDQKVSTDDTNTITNPLDKVKLEEYTTANTALNGAQAYLEDNGSSLSPYYWKPNVQTGVRATLDTTTSGTTFKDVSLLYRFLVVKVVRVVKVDYVIEDTNGLLGENANKAVLMLQMREYDQNNVMTACYSSDAVTSPSQDSVADSSGSYTVRFRNILATDNMLYVSSMLPSGCKMSGYRIDTSNTTSGVQWNNTDQCIQIPSGNNNQQDATTVHVTLIATVAADPSWGIRDMTGGIG